MNLKTLRQRQDLKSNQTEEANHQQRNDNQRLTAEISCKHHCKIENIGIIFSKYCEKMIVFLELSNCLGVSFEYEGAINICSELRLYPNKYLLNEILRNHENKNF